MRPRTSVDNRPPGPNPVLRWFGSAGRGAEGVKPGPVGTVFTGELLTGLFFLGPLRPTPYDLYSATSIRLLVERSSVRSQDFLVISHVHPDPL
jgi:hypothetical protein